MTPSKPLFSPSKGQLFSQRKQSHLLVKPTWDNSTAMSSQKRYSISSLTKKPFLARPSIESAADRVVSSSKKSRQSQLEEHRTPKIKAEKLDMIIAGAQPSQSLNQISPFNLRS